MPRNVLVLPILIPMVAGVLLVIARSRTAQRWISTASGALALCVSLTLLARVWNGGILTLAIGGFPAPFGIVLVADLLSAMMLVLTNIVALAVLAHSFLTIDEERERHYYYAFLQFLVMGISGSFVTGDLFNLFVWFEVMLFASYVLVTLGGGAFQLREAFKYVVLNIIASSLFLVGVGVVYASLGTVNMADLAVKAASVSNKGLFLAMAFIFLIVFGIKAAVFPLYFWLPRSYDAPPAAVAAIFGGLLTKVGVYSLIRVFTLIFVGQPAVTHTLIMWLAGFTLVVGVMGAIAQSDFRRIISYHVISHIGYMLMGLGVFTPFALAGSLFYLAHDTIVKPALYLIGGVAERITGTTDLRRYGGLIHKFPGLTLVFFLGALSLVGIPPMSGFFGKFAAIQGGFLAGRYGISAVALVVSLLILYSLILVFKEGFWGEQAGSGEGGWERPQGYLWLLAPASALILLSAAMGLGAEFVAQLATKSAMQLLNPEDYIRAVLHSEPADYVQSALGL